MHTITEVSPVQPDGKGSIGGWEAICSCGYRMTTSLSEYWAAKLGLEHVAYMERNSR